MTNYTLQKADNFFTNKDYQSALHFYSNILTNNPEDKDAQIGLLLTDMAINDDEEKAHTLFDYYVIIKDQDIQIAFEAINDLIHENVDEDINDKINTMDGLTYKDFEEILALNPDNTKEIFDNIIFSTKLIIANKQEFLEFIILLLKYDFNHMIFNYLENFILTFGQSETTLDISKTLSMLETNI
jgi:tetratricopeptide (TPR) repeat protein